MHCGATSLKIKSDSGKNAMNNVSQNAIENFIINLTGASITEIQEYTTEIKLNRDFHNCIDENRSIYGRRTSSYWDFGIGKSLGMVLYITCRKQRPDIVVETGVASGISSSYILCALNQNSHGHLYSIDLPRWQKNESGWIIPNYLKRRWQLILGRSSAELAPLLQKVIEIDIFLHDSDHSYQNMLWEFQTVWKHLKTGGLLLSHNIDNNNAFSDFCQNVGAKGYSLSNMGGIFKN